MPARSGKRGRHVWQVVVSAEAAFLGHGFSGWQRQAISNPTVQGVIEAGWRAALGVSAVDNSVYAGADIRLDTQVSAMVFPLVLRAPVELLDRVGCPTQLMMATADTPQDAVDALRAWILTAINSNTAVPPTVKITKVITIRIQAPRGRALSPDAAAIPPESGAAGKSTAHPAAATGSGGSSGERACTRSTLWSGSVDASSTDAHGAEGSMAAADGNGSIRVGADVCRGEISPAPFGDWTTALLQLRDASSHLPAINTPNGKVYRYYALCGIPDDAVTPACSTLFRTYPTPLFHRAAMVAEAAAVIGVHDFRRLSKSGGSEHTTRLVRACTIRFFRPPTEETAQAVLDGGDAAGAADNNDPVLAVIDVEGEGFLRHMVRAIAKALLDVGFGRAATGHMAAMLNETAPSAKGAGVGSGTSVGGNHDSGSGSGGDLGRSSAAAAAAGTGNFVCGNSGAASGDATSNAEPGPRPRQSAASVHRMRKAAGGGCLAAAAKNLWLVGVTYASDTPN